jgi:hypothetical protein
LRQKKFYRNGTREQALTPTALMAQSDRKPTFSNPQTLARHV